MKRQLIMLVALLALPLSAFAIDGSAAKRGGRVDTFAPSYDFWTAASQGKVEGVSASFGPGHNHDVDISASEEVWGYGGIRTNPTTGTSLWCSSSSASASQIIAVVGLDGLGLQQTVAVTLNGTTPTQVSGSWYRVHSISNINGSDFIGDAFVFTTGTVTAGVPDTAATVQASIHNPGALMENSSLQAMRTVPANMNGYLIMWKGGVVKSQEVILRLQFRPNGGVWQTIDTMNLYQATLIAQSPFPLALSPMTDVRIVATTDANNTNVEAAFLMYLVEN